MAKRYCPNRGDVIWISFDPQAGHEQAGLRPAFILSPEAYNKKVGLVLLWPITNQHKGYPFEVEIPDGLEASGRSMAADAMAVRVVRPRTVGPLRITEIPGDEVRL